VPTLEQFYHTVEDIRAQRFKGAAEESADFVQLG